MMPITLSQTSLRRSFMDSFFVQAKNLRYSFLKFFFTDLDDIPEHADIDLIIEADSLPEWERIIQYAEGLQQYAIRHTSYASYVQMYFEDKSYLEIDLIHQIKWKSWIFMDCEAVMIRSAESHEGIIVADWEDAFIYILGFFTLNKCPIPQKYQDFFHQLDLDHQLQILSAVSEHYLCPDLQTRNLFDCESLYDCIRRTISIRPENRSWRKIPNTIKSIGDRFKNRQPTISFSGVDGAGKSTILSRTQSLLTEKYRREVVVLRQRPSILPILSSIKYGKELAEHKAATTLPRQGTNQNRFSSILRFGYYYLDYVLGQWWIEWKYNRRGRVVLYDRYYFDFIVDGRRANLALPSNWIRPLYKWVFKPELNFLLYADYNTILSRKQELSKKDIIQLTDAFQTLFRKLDERAESYVMIDNIELEETMERIEDCFIELAAIR